MSENKKYSTPLIIAVIFCFIGCSLLAAQKFIESEYDLFSIALALNGIGIMLFLYAGNANKAK